jgi:hypothetical protein
MASWIRSPQYYERTTDERRDNLVSQLRLAQEKLVACAGDAKALALAAAEGDQRCQREYAKALREADQAKLTCQMAADALEALEKVRAEQDRLKREERQSKADAAREVQYWAMVNEQTVAYTVEINKLDATGQTHQAGLMRRELEELPQRAAKFVGLTYVPKGKEATDAEA